MNDLRIYSLVVSSSNFGFIGESSCLKRFFTCSKVSFDAISLANLASMAGRLENVVVRHDDIR